MSHVKGKVLSILLAAAMMLGMMPAIGFSAYAESADGAVLTEETSDHSAGAETKAEAVPADTNETAVTEASDPAETKAESTAAEALTEDTAAAAEDEETAGAAEASEEPSETESVEVPRFMLKGGPTKAPGRTVTSENVHLSQPLSEIASYGKPVVAPTFTLESSDLQVRTDTAYSFWIRKDAGESGSVVTDPTFGAGTYAYRVCIEAADATIDFDSSSTQLNVDGASWTRVTDFYDSEAGVCCCIYQSPDIKISGQWETPRALLMPSSGDQFALWTKVEGATSYDLILTNTDQLYPRTMTINVTSWLDWHEHDAEHLQNYDLWIDLQYKLPEITVRSGHQTYTLQVIAKGPGKADSEPSKVSTYSYSVYTVLDNINIDANGKLTWDPYTNAADPEAKIYHVSIYRPDGSFLVDIWTDNTYLDLEACIEKYGRVKGNYKVEVSGWDARENAGGKKLSGTMLRIYEYTPKIKTISIDGLTQPREGEMAQIYLGDLSVAEEHVYLPKDGDGYGYWQQKSGPVWPSMLPTDTFEATGTYRASIPILYDEDYALANNVKVKVNDQEVEAEIELIGDIGKRHAARVYCPMNVILSNSNTYVVTAGSLNVRAAANTSSDRVGGLSYGDVVEAKGQMGGFVQIDYEGRTAWVAARYLALTYSKEAAIDPLTYTVAYGAVNVRSAPDNTADNRIGGYTNGKEILVTGRVQDADGNVWVTVDYNDGSGSKLGFVMEKYLYSGGSLEGTPPPIVPAEENTDDTDLEVDTGVDAKISFSWKSAKPKITEGDKVSLGEENFISEDGYLIATVYPDDATNFSGLTKANVKLPAGLTDAGYELSDLTLNTNGSITLKIGLKDPVVVTFDANGHGSAPAAQTVGAGRKATEPDDLTETGWTFGGWYEDPACTTAFDFSTPITADLTVYAKWTKNEEAKTFTIRYDLNGGTLDGKTGIVTVSVEEGKTITLPLPTRDGYTFDYWEGSHYDAGDSYTVEGDHTFTAQWKKTSTPADPGKTEENKPGGGNNVSTGDNSPMALYAGLMLLSLLGIGGMLLYRRKFTD